MSADEETAGLTVIAAHAPSPSACPPSIAIVRVQRGCDQLDKMLTK
jgi:hypothetical protein